MKPDQPILDQMARAYNRRMVLLQIRKDDDKSLSYSKPATIRLQLQARSS